MNSRETLHLSGLLPFASPRRSNFEKFANASERDSQFESPLLHQEVGRIACASHLPPERGRGRKSVPRRKTRLGCRARDWRRIAALRDDSILACPKWPPDTPGPAGDQSADLAKATPLKGHDRCVLPACRTNRGGAALVGVVDKSAGEPDDFCGRAKERNMKGKLLQAIAVAVAILAASAAAGQIQAPTPQAQTVPPLTPQQLDQMLAPIALYPDGLLMDILMAATYP